MATASERAAQEMAAAEQRFLETCITAMRYTDEHPDQLAGDLRSKVRQAWLRYSALLAVVDESQLPRVHVLSGGMGD